MMNKEKFIDAIKEVVFKSTIVSVESSITKPPGRQPSANLVQMSQWYNSLDIQSQKMMQLLIRMTAHDAVFGMLAVLDGVRAIEDTTDKGELKLFFEKDGKQTLLNTQQGMTLHDLFNAQSL